MYWIIFPILAALAVIYILVCYIVYRCENKKMIDQINVATNIPYGEQSLAEMRKKQPQTEYFLYDENERAADPKKADVKLYRFGIDKKTDFVLVCPGGGYGCCVLSTEGFPIAAKINELGYNAFILEYRTGKNSSLYAPLYDLARAVEFIQTHAEELNVNAENYAVCGFSAGGNLIGLFGDINMGFQQNVTPPSALIMGYPWCNLNTKTWSVVDKIRFAGLNHGGHVYMLENKKELFPTLLLPRHVSPEYPATYIMHGTADNLVPIKTHPDVFVEKLKENGIPVRYDRIPGICHGIGLGENTAAANWLDTAVEFWQQQNKAKQSRTDKIRQIEYHQKSETVYAQP